MAKDGQKKEGVEELEGKLRAVTEEIRGILGGRKDKKDVGEDDKATLRAKYSQAAQIARTLSNRCTDTEKIEKYSKFYKQLSDAAASYGSVLKSKVPNTTLDDVKGLDDVKALVKSFIFMARNPEILKYYKMEGGLGMLMYGAPGTGKTMFAEAIANAMNLPLFIVTPADIFKSYVGESEQAVKQIFDEIDTCPDGAILFVDECESIFSKRTQDTKDYKSAVTTELLQRIKIGATNRPDVIDPAYLRYKRFSHIIHVTPPDFDAKRAIIEGKLKGIDLDGISLEEVVNMTKEYTNEVDDKGEVRTVAYYSAADICGIIEESCRYALEEIEEKGGDKPIPLRLDMFERAFEKIPPSISAELLEDYENFRNTH